MTVEELAERIDSRELTEWAAFERVEGPIGATRTDGQAGIIASTFANAHRKKGAKAFEVDDFVPKWEELGAKAFEEEVVDLDPEAQRMAMFKALGGRMPREEAPRKRLLDAKGEPIQREGEAD